MTTRATCSLGALAFAGFALAFLAPISPTAHAALVDLSGDLGSNFWAGNAFSPIGPAGAITTPFTHTFANGTVTGNAISTNATGFALSLKLTNLTFTTFAPGPSAGMTEILLVATHNFQIGPASNYFANHNATGTWSTATGNMVQLQTNVDINGTSPGAIQQIVMVNSAGTTSFGSASPAIGGNTTSTVLTIQMFLRLRIDGVGTTTLPGSADVDVTFVPAPGVAVIGLAGLLRRRKR